MHPTADAMTGELANDPVATSYGDALYGCSDIPQSRPGLSGAHAGSERSLCGEHQTPSPRVNRPHRYGHGSIRVIAIDLRRDVECDELPLSKDPLARDTVDHLIVNAHADRPGIAVGQNRTGPSTLLGEQIICELIKLGSRDTWSDGAT
jgi:hypothetical protein